MIYNAPDAARTWQELVDKGPWEALRGRRSRARWFQTLMHIAVTSLWILPVIRAAPLVRIAYMIASAALQVLLSHWFYFDWVHTGGIDGGVLGFLSWTIPTIIGTLACDAVTAADGRPRVAKMIVWAIVLMAAGWLLSCGTTLYDVRRRPGRQPRRTRCAPPTRSCPAASDWRRTRSPGPSRRSCRRPDRDHRKENYWMMSQRAATVSYHVFAAGLVAGRCMRCSTSPATCGAGSWACFARWAPTPWWATSCTAWSTDAVAPFIPSDAPGWYVTAGFLLYFGITYLFIRHLEKNNIYLKL